MKAVRALSRAELDSGELSLQRLAILEANLMF